MEAISKVQLNKIVKNDAAYQTRQRAQSILLSNDGISVKEISKIFRKQIGGSNNEQCNVLPNIINKVIITGHI